MQVFRFDLVAGTNDRRMLMNDLGDWLRERVGLGFFSIADSEDEIPDATQWIVVCSSDTLKVIIRRDENATLFALQWT